MLLLIKTYDATKHWLQASTDLLSLTHFAHPVILSTLTRVELLSINTSDFDTIVKDFQVRYGNWMRWDGMYEISVDICTHSYHLLRIPIT